MVFKTDVSVASYATTRRVFEYSRILDGMLETYFAHHALTTRSLHRAPAI